MFGAGRLWGRGENGLLGFKNLETISLEMGWCSERWGGVLLSDTLQMPRSRVPSASQGRGISLLKQRRFSATD